MLATINYAKRYIRKKKELETIHQTVHIANCKIVAGAGELGESGIYTYYPVQPSTPKKKDMQYNERKLIKLWW